MRALLTERSSADMDERHCVGKRLRIGQRVRVCYGALAGVEGVIIQVDGGGLLTLRLDAEPGVLLRIPQQRVDTEINW